MAEYAVPDGRVSELGLPFTPRPVVCTPVGVVNDVAPAPPAPTVIVIFPEVTASAAPLGVFGDSVP